MDRLKYLDKKIRGFSRAQPYDWTLEGWLPFETNIILPTQSHRLLYTTSMTATVTVSTNEYQQ